MRFPPCFKINDLRHRFWRHIPAPHGISDSIKDSLRKYLSLEDFRRGARRHLPVPIFGYVDGGVETGAGLRHARSAYERLAFVPSLLRNASARGTKTCLFGMTHSVPFGIAPMGFSALAAYDGDVVLARAARASGSFALQRGIAHPA